jgi:hypothetical protein
MSHFRKLFLSGLQIHEWIIFLLMPMSRIRNICGNNIAR